MIQNFEEKLREYASLLVNVGINPQPGQIVRVAAPVDCAKLARLCVQVCYDRGVREVMMDWSDDFVTRQKYLRADPAVFTEVPSYLAGKYEYMREKNIAQLDIIGEDPELLSGVEPARVQNWQRVSGNAIKPFQQAMMAGQFQWSLGAHPTPAWARKVFPDAGSEEAAMELLWQAVFAACRITGDGRAVERWRAHIKAVHARVEKLNAYAFQTLRYTSGLGTDLIVALPEGHLWSGAGERTEGGVEFVANMPTEEIFTAPRYDAVNGRVYASMPLVLDGNLVQDFWLQFRDGKIVDLYAGQGEEYLRSSIQVDEGSSYLGEVALVPYDSPIRNTEILFYNTLFDENASCHLAYGAAYANCVRGAERLSEEEQKALGLNQSVNHVDFMIGTADLSIVGTTADGREIAVFRDGNFCL